MAHESGDVDGAYHDAGQLTFFIAECSRACVRQPNLVEHRDPHRIVKVDENPVSENGRSVPRFPRFPRPQVSQASRFRVPRFRTLALLAACILPLLADLIGEGIVFDRQDEDVRAVAVVGSNFMSLSGLEELSQGLRSASRAPPRALIISAFANSGDASQTLAGKGRTEVTYDEAVAQLRAARARGTFRMMRLISVGDNTVIQTVNGTKISRSVLAGVDPTIFEVAETPGTETPGTDRPFPDHVVITKSNDSCAESSRHFRGRPPFCWADQALLQRREHERPGR